MFLYWNFLHLSNRIQIPNVFVFHILEGCFFSFLLCSNDMLLCKQLKQKPNLLNDLPFVSVVFSSQPKPEETLVLCHLRQCAQELQHWTSTSADYVLFFSVKCPRSNTHISRNFTGKELARLTFECHLLFNMQFFSLYTGTNV